MNYLVATAYQESKFAQFTSIQRCSPSPLIPLTDGYPVQACDNGYGIMQLTQGIPGGLNYHLNRYTGTPTQDMIWNWVANINNGETTMLEKLNEEIAYEKRMVDQQGAYYLSAEQRQMNVWQYYNGGYYWIWRAGQWITNPTLQPTGCGSTNPNTPPVSAPYAKCVQSLSQNNQQWCAK